MMEGGPLFLFKSNQDFAILEMEEGGNSLVAQWLKNPPANAGDSVSIPGLGRSHMPQSN